MSEQEKILEDLYDVVTSPETYDRFMVSLQGKLDAMRSVSSQDSANFISAHMKRAAALVDIVTPWRRDVDEELHRQIVQRMQATMAVDEYGHVLDANTSAKVIYDLVPGSTIWDLPIEAEGGPVAV